MTNRVYKTVEITGTSTAGVDDAIHGAIGKAGESLRHLDWFEVAAIRGNIVDGRIDHFQVTLKLGFRVED